LGALGEVALIVAFAAAKFYALRDRHPVHSGDRTWWDLIGRLSFTDANFWLNERPFTVPLLHKLAGFSEPRVIVLQAVLDFVAWATLAHVLSLLIRSLPARLLACAAVLGLGLTSGVQGWNLVMRSESASTSLLVLTLAATLASIHAGSRRSAGLGEQSRAERRARRSALAWAALAVASGLFAAFARDNNAYALVLVAFFAPLGALLVSGRKLRTARRELGPVVALSLGLLVVAGASRANAKAAERYKWPLMNVVFWRVLPSRAQTAYFERELGMPVSPALLGRRHHFVSAGNFYVARAPELESFRAWVTTRGYAAYQRYLLTHPVSTTRAAWRNFVAVAGDIEDRHTHGAINRISLFFDGILVDPLGDAPGLSVVLLAVLGSLGLFAPRAEFRLLSAFGLLCLGLALTQAYVCYHADAMEVSRHSLNVGLCLRLSGVTALGGLASFAQVLLAAAFRRSLSDEAVIS
jgi:hypothetical protein